MRHRVHEKNVCVHIKRAFYVLDKDASSINKSIVTNCVYCSIDSISSSSLSDVVLHGPHERDFASDLA